MDYIAWEQNSYLLEFKYRCLNDDPQGFQNLEGLKVDRKNPHQPNTDFILSIFRITTINQAKSKRSRFITLFQTVTKSFTNFP